MTLSSNGIGAPAYFSSYLNRIREAHPDFPLDPVIFQSILLCLIAGGPHGHYGETSSRGSKHLILRTSPEDVGLVMNIAALSVLLPQPVNRVVTYLLGEFSEPNASSIQSTQLGDVLSHLLHLTTISDDAVMHCLFSWVFTTVFGFPTHKYKAKRDLKVNSIQPQNTHSLDHPNDFLRRLFLREKHFHRHSSLADRAHRDRSRRPGSGHAPKRSSTLPMTGSIDSPGYSSSPLPSPLHTRESTLDSQTDTTSVASRRMPISPASTLRLRPQAPRAQTEPTSVKKYTDAQPIPISAGTSHSNAHSAATHLPRALVVSGLELVEIPAQRILLRALQDCKITFDSESHELPSGLEGTWDLSSDFLLLYVCPLDPHERPPLLETLLDRFSMSADVNISSSVRQAYTVYRSSISTPLSASFHSVSPRMPLSALHPLDASGASPSPRLRQLPLGTSPQLTPTNTTTAPIISSEELDELRALTVPAPIPTPNAEPEANNSAPEAYTFIHPSLNIYLGDLFSATRHHPLLDGTLITLRAHRDAEDLVRAYRVICGDSIGAELVTMVAGAPSLHGPESDSQTDDELHTIDGRDFWEPEKRAEESEWLGAELNAGRRKASSVRSVEVRVQAPDNEIEERERRLGSRVSLAVGSFLSPLPLPPDVWDVSEVDIGRVFPRVVSHRVRVRSGPDDEILGSIMHPAVHQQSPADSSTEERKTVKQIIVGILADV